MSALEFGKAAIRLSLLSDDIEKQLNSFQAKLEKFGKKFINVGKSFSLVGGAIVAPFAAGIKQLVGFGAQLDDLHQRSSISVEALQALGFAAEQNGGTLDDVGSAAQTMAAQLLMAGRGSKKALTNLDDLGLSLKDLDGLTGTEKFLRFADAISKVEDPLKQAALAEKIFGGAGYQLLPMLKGGATGIQELMKQSQALGPALSSQTTAAAAKLDDKLAALWTSTKRLSMQLGAAVVGPITAFVNSITPIVAAIGRWIQNNQTLVAWLAAVGVVLLGVGSVLLTTGTLVLFAAKAINVAKIAVSGVTGAVKALSVAVAFLCRNPIVALITVIAGLIVYVLYATGVLGKLFGWIGKIVGVTDDATDSAENFNDALSKLKTPDIDFDKLKSGLNVNTDSVAKGGMSEARQASAFFDTSLARQQIGDGNVQLQQLNELKRVNKNLERQGKGVPVI